MYKRQKVPARKKVFCHRNGKPYKRHKEIYWAHREQEGLTAKFPGKKFELRTCEFCKCLHVMEER